MDLKLGTIERPKIVIQDSDIFIEFSFRKDAEIIIDEDTVSVFRNEGWYSSGLEINKHMVKFRSYNQHGQLVTKMEITPEVKMKLINYLMKFDKDGKN